MVQFDKWRDGADKDNLAVCAFDDNISDPDSLSAWRIPGVRQIVYHMRDSISEYSGCVNHFAFC
jgi:hypothetical protein